MRSAPLLALLAPLAPLALLAGAVPHAALAQAVSPARDSVRDDRFFSFYDRGPYRPAVPRPETTLGYQLGEANTQYAAQERVLLAIADAAKDRVRVEEIGSSYERRTMRLYIVSAPENIQRLETIRRDLDRLADPRGAPAAELDALAARTPAVVWIAGSVHGNESPGFEATMQLLYQFAASEDPATLAALRRTIVVINPSSNPDGHERFAVWYNSINVRDPDPIALEHDEPWSVQGRYNHYRFDMNRDVIATTQREVQAMVRGMLRWHPMVAIDLHGQTTNYFFPPAARPINAHITEEARRWLEILGRGNAQAFDRYGWMYYTRDIFDLYYPGYWDTWPSLTGAMGMTFETDGGGWKGILWRREDGSLLSFRDGIAKHYVAALTSVLTTGARADERVRDYLAARRGAIAAGQRGPMRRVVLVPGSDPGRAAELVSALLRSGIEVRRARDGFAAERAHAYADGAVGTRRFGAGTYVVDLAQPQGHLARAVLEPAPTLDPVFAQAQVERYRRNIRRGKVERREDYEFYDVTAWSLPVAFGVESYWTEDAAPVVGDLLTLPAEEPALPQAQQRPQRIGGELLAVDFPRGVRGGERARSAYLFTAERNGASRLAYHLLDEGFRVAVATQPVDAGGRRWPRGTYIVRVARNDTTLHARIDALSRESGVEVTPVASASTESGQFGIGSENVVSLTLPRIAVVGDEGIAQTSYGALWFGFERRYGIRFTPLGFGALTGSDITKFNVIILPHGSASGIGSRLGKDGAERLKRWVESGGTLVTMGGASAWAARESSGLTTARAVGSAGAADTAARDDRTPSSDDSTAAQRRREHTPDRVLDDLLPLTSPSASNTSPVPVPGSHFDVELDRTHWLTVGYEQPRLTVLLEGRLFLSPSREGSNVAVFPRRGTLHRAGFIWPENTERLLRGTSLLVAEPLGDGHVVLFANEPMFRGWWRALDRLVLNAVLLGPAM